ncbi:MAG: AAA family ATPase [archaeon]
MGIFDNMLHNNESLFKDEYSLDYSFIPKIIPYRKKEQEAIANCIRPLLAGHNGRNALIHGAPGIGKTAACKHLLRELDEHDEYADKLLLLYVNCWQKNTSFKVAVDVCEQAGYMFTQNKKTDELFSIFANIANKKQVIFIIDEVDKAEETDFLYTLSEDIFKKSILLITNYKSWLLELDDRIKSRITPTLIAFNEYDETETTGILRQRMNYAFIDNVWEEHAFVSIAQKTAQLKDIRSGLFLLKETGIIAEEHASRKITADHARQAITKLNEFTIKSKEALEEETQKILDIIKKNAGQKIGELYKRYQTAGGHVSYKTFQRKLAKLDEDKFITLEKSKGYGGNTTIVDRKLGEF